MNTLWVSAWSHQGNVARYPIRYFVPAWRWTEDGRARLRGWAKRLLLVRNINAVIIYTTTVWTEEQWFTWGSKTGRERPAALICSPRSSTAYISKLESYWVTSFLGTRLRRFINSPARPQYSTYLNWIWLVVLHDVIITKDSMNINFLISL